MPNSSYCESLFSHINDVFSGPPTENLKKLVAEPQLADALSRLEVSRCSGTTIGSHQDYFARLQYLYNPFQQGTANEYNFMWNTAVEFRERKTRPKGSPDYISYNRYGEVSSEYWYTKTGVVRGSDHWGPGVASCDWMLNTLSLGGFNHDNPYGLCVTYKRYGTARWTSFVHKTLLIVVDGKAIGASSFATTTGKEEVVFDGITYTKEDFSPEPEWEI